MRERAKKATKRKLPKQAIESLKVEYHELASKAEEFSAELVRQFTEICEQELISLAVPIESRVKSWHSIGEKLERKSLTISSISDLQDLVGVRSILLFRRDVDRVARVVANKFTVIAKEDTIERLSPSQFGYSSIHFIIEVPSEWLKVPTLAKF